MNVITMIIIFISTTSVIDVIRWGIFTLTFLSTLQYAYIIIGVIGWANQVWVVLLLNTAFHGMTVLYFLALMSLSENHTTKNGSLFGLVLSPFTFMIDVPAITLWITYGSLLLLIPFVSLISITTVVIYIELKQDDVLYIPRDN